MLGHPVAENPIDQMVDVIANPRIKTFLAAAREHGCPVVDDVAETLGE